MQLINELNQLTRHKPQHITSTDDIAYAADFILALGEFAELVRDVKRKELEVYEYKLSEACSIYMDIDVQVNDLKNEIYDKIQNYVKTSQNPEKLIEKRIKGEKAAILFMVDKNVEVINKRRFA